MRTGDRINKAPIGDQVETGTEPRAAIILLVHYSRDCWLWKAGGAGRTLGKASSKEPQKSHREGAAYTKYHLKTKFRKSWLLGLGSIRT